MRDEHTFLVERNAKRSCERTENHAESGLHPFLNPSLEIPLRYHWLIFPINGHSERSFSWDRFAPASRDRVKIELWAYEWVNLNWGVVTGSYARDRTDGLIALEIQPDLARYGLVELTGDEWEWKNTLHFVRGDRWFFFFQHAPGLRSLKGLPGMRLYAGDYNSDVLIPPSRTPDTSKITWVDPEAPWLPAPDWLLETVCSK